MEEHLVLKNISKNFGEVEAVKDVSLSFKRGELVTLLGPSGCGKTTTLHMIAGFHIPERGSIVLSGKEITFLPAYKRKTPMVFQEYALFPHLTIFENIAYGLKIQKKDGKYIKNKVENVLNQLGLPPLSDRFPNQLSGGQQQRIALARALVLDPEVLLLDEPLSNLDAKLRIQVRYEIKELQNRLKITMIYVTHDQEEALSISDKVAVMNKGVVEQFGTPWEIYHRPKNEFVAGFVGETNFLPVTVTDLRKETGNTVVEFIWRDRILSLPTNRTDLNKGSQKTLLLRPEAITLSKTLSTNVNNQYLPGTVKQRSFLGAITRYWIDIGNQEVVVDDSKTGENGIYDNEVFRSFSGENTYFL